MVVRYVEGFDHYKGVVEMAGNRIVSGQHRAAAAAEAGRPVVCRDVLTGERSLRMAVPKGYSTGPRKHPPKARALAIALHGMENPPSAWRRLPKAERERLTARAAEAMRRAGVS